MTLKDELPRLIGGQHAPEGRRGLAKKPQNKPNQKLSFIERYYQETLIKNAGLAEFPHLPTCVSYKCPILINLLLAYRKKERNARILFLP